MIERYLQIRAATVAGHLPSGELGYLADVTGLLQLWRVAPDGLHEQVTFASERITAALPSPREERWVIARDAGGNERHALFAIDPAGRPGACRSPSDPEAIHVPGRVLARRRAASRSPTRAATASTSTSPSWP